MTSIVTTNMENGHIIVEVVIDPDRKLLYRAEADSNVIDAIEAKLAAYRVLIKTMGNDLYRASRDLEKFYDHEFKGTSLDDDDPE